MVRRAQCGETPEQEWYIEQIDGEVGANVLWKTNATEMQQLLEEIDKMKDASYQECLQVTPDF